MMAVMLTGQRIMLIITQWLVCPLILILLGVTLYLIPTWNFSAFRGVPTPGEFLMSVWLVIPVLVFAFNHSPAISQFSVAMKHEYGDRASERASVAAFIFITGWITAVANPSILSLIKSLAGPVIAVILYLMPMYAIRRLPGLEPYRGKISNVFVTVAGIVAVSGIVYGLLP